MLFLISLTYEKVYLLNGLKLFEKNQSNFNIFFNEIFQKIEYNKKRTFFYIL